MIKNYDVIIVGGGLIGASLACALRNSPLRIAIIEAIPSLERLDRNFDSRAITLAYGSKKIFDSMDIWQLLEIYAIPILQVHISDRGHFGVTRFTASEKKLPALGYVIEVSDLISRLHQTCRAADNIDWYCPAVVKTIKVDNKNTHVVLEIEHSELTIQGQLVVGSDGERSKVRTSQQISAQTWEYDQCAIVSNIGLQRPHQSIAYERFTAEGPLAMLPLSNQRVSSVWSLPASVVEKIRELPDQQYLEHLQRAFGYRLGRFVKVGKRQVFPLQLVRATQQYREGIVLIGNASHTIHPIAGQGFNLGLRDVAVLVDVLINAWQQGEWLGDEKILKRYQQWRQWDQSQIINLCDGLTRLFSNDYWPHRLIRDLALCMVDRVAPIKNILLDRTMGIAGNLPRLSCGLPVMEEKYETV